MGNNLGGFDATGLLTANAPGQIPSMNGGVVPSTMFVASAGQTVAATTDTSVFAGGKGTQIVPAGGSYQGNTYRLKVSGVMTTPLANLATLTVKVMWGSTVVATITSAALAASLASAKWTLEALLTIRSVSATAGQSVAVCDGELKVAGLVAASLITATTGTLIDTTTAAKIDLTTAFSTIAGSQTLTSITGTIEILY